MGTFAEYYRARQINEAGNTAGSSPGGPSRLPTPGSQPPVQSGIPQNVAPQRTMNVDTLAKELGVRWNDVTGVIKKLFASAPTGAAQGNLDKLGPSSIIKEKLATKIRQILRPDIYGPQAQQASHDAFAGDREAAKVLAKRPNHAR